jgi:hypothetical protein
VLGKTAWLKLSVSFFVGTLCVLLVPVVASAHVERASYWPDPAPDCSISPCAGGAVPTPRSLASAVNTDRSITRVVCQQNSLRLAQRSIEKAESKGYVLRPSQGTQTITASEGHSLLDVNRKLFGRCRYSSIQVAVNESGNNDRVVIMPGLYTEPQSRAAPTHDPACTQYQITNDRGDTVALSYKYQWYCPNDQNLIAILGREPGANDPPDPPALDRHGIPDLGSCVRCNLQVEGSGVGADDVIIDAGRVQSGDGAPIGDEKDVGIRADRADGVVIRNLKVRHAAEHDIYVLESDGYLLERFKTFWAGEYGVLTFVEDHGLMQDCEAAGNGDSGLYPGAGADTGAQRDSAPQAWKDYADPGYSYANFRYSQEIRYCDMHHNAGGYSGTDGNATHIDHNDFYDNALGFTTDVFTAPGHPGFPQDSDLIEYNNFYDNNFNPYVSQPTATTVVPTIPVPVGTGLWIAGGNDNIVRNNYFYDNWRRGTMLFAVPDQLVCGPAGIDPSQLAGCNPTAVPPSTSYRNEFYGNVMGRTPGGRVKPNGTGDLTTGRVDFWWDQYSGTTGNCWHDNTGKGGNAPSVTSVPPGPALPSDCATSVGTGGPAQEQELVDCFLSIEGNPNNCDWFTTPSRP